jgi:hypothetical protein
MKPFGDAKTTGPHQKHLYCIRGLHLAGIYSTYTFIMARERNSSLLDCQPNPFRLIIKRKV